jgi:hypothetical protein
MRAFAGHKSDELIRQMRAIFSLKPINFCKATKGHVSSSAANNVAAFALAK